MSVMSDGAKPDEIAFNCVGVLPFLVAFRPCSEGKGRRGGWSTTGLTQIRRCNTERGGGFLDETEGDARWKEMSEEGEGEIERR